MKTFVLMTKLSPEIAMKMKDRERLGREWLEQVKKKCPEVKFIAHYGLLGPYDFMDIYEAPDEETACKVSMISMQHGAFTAESWITIPYKQIVQLADEI
ncbi:MAG: GYD domain-containing protein [candidate division Zixibacteria bacterium]|nr:GYD domain-containing protein [candidate division Zixibacteria bacterium]